MSFDAKSGILKAIAETQDHNLKTILLLLLGVLEELGSKIDAIADDEKGLREAVLNGHAKDHDAHHEWIAAKIITAKDQDKVCNWAAKQMQDEAENARTKADEARADKRAARDAVIRTVTASIITGLIAVVGTLLALR